MCAEGLFSHSPRHQTFARKQHRVAAPKLGRPHRFERAGVAPDCGMDSVSDNMGLDFDGATGRLIQDDKALE